MGELIEKAKDELLIPETHLNTSLNGKYLGFIPFLVYKWKQFLIPEAAFYLPQQEHL